ncbi:hypothetical protein AAE478_008813 [Parahypoxylon ruwenzoriense]
MAEEPTLPKLPAVSWNFETQTFTNTRKRARDGASAQPLFNNSSDPAVFSSDDDPHIENYTQGRHRKKRYVGSWFQQHPTSSDSTFSEAVRPLPKTKKRTFERQFDSGVWMGSDSSVDIEDGATHMNIPAESKLPQLRHARPMAPLSPRESAIRNAIQDAIDRGIEKIDLSSFNVENIPNATISQLSEFACIPLVTEDVPFEHEEPRLEIYLAKNPLLRAPGALFNLEHLTVLSLRNTQITEIPPSIGNLRNLETLNVSLTRLRYLPGELLDLLRYPGKLRTLSIHPNPFYRPDHLEVKFKNDVWDPSCEDVVLLSQIPRIDGSRKRWWLDKRDGFWDELPEQPGLEGWEVFALGRSPVQFNDSRGVIVSKFRLHQPDSDTIPTEDLSSLPAVPHSTRNRAAPNDSPSRVLPLFELALRSCSRIAPLDELPSYLPQNSPSHLTKILSRIALQSEENANSGDLPCSKHQGREGSAISTAGLLLELLAGTNGIRTEAIRDHKMELRIPKGHDKCLSLTGKTN